MPHMTLAEAQQIIEQVVENPGGCRHVTERQLAQACAVVLARNGLLFPGPNDE